MIIHDQHIVNDIRFNIVAMNTLGLGYRAKERNMIWLKYKHVKNQGYKQGYAQWVINDILDVLCRPQGSYPESFVSLSLFLAEI